MMTYTASAKETFDHMALNIYGDEQYAYLLLSANPTQCHKIMMEGGEVLNVPGMPVDEPAGLPPWKRRG